MEDNSLHHMEESLMDALGRTFIAPILVLPHAAGTRGSPTPKPKPL